MVKSLCTSQLATALGDPELLTPQQAADLLNVRISWVYERTRVQQIPHKRIGKYVRIPKAELLAWVDAQSSAA